MGTRPPPPPLNKKKNKKVEVSVQDDLLLGASPPAFLSDVLHPSIRSATLQDRNLRLLEEEDRLAEGGSDSPS